MTKRRRPTPEQIESHHLAYTNIPSLIGVLEAHGYRIVHPDDVPERQDAFPPDAWDMGHQCGWNDCRADIFGDKS